LIVMSLFVLCLTSSRFPESIHIVKTPEPCNLRRFILTFDCGGD
jgi:hypothetical protein